MKIYFSKTILTLFISLLSVPVLSISLTSTIALGDSETKLYEQNSQFFAAHERRLEQDIKDLESVQVIGWLQKANLIVLGKKTQSLEMVRAAHTLYENNKKSVKATFTDLREISDFLKLKKFSESQSPPVRKVSSVESSVGSIDIHSTSLPFFDEENFPDQARFLAKLGVKKPESETSYPPKQDLSSRFPEPMIIGNPLLKSSSAILSDIETFENVPILSPSFFYQSMASLTDTNEPDLTDLFEILDTTGIPTETDFPSAKEEPGTKLGEKAVSPLKPDESGARYKAEGHVEIFIGESRDINFAFVRLLIHSGIPFIAFVEADKRNYTEDWIQLVKSSPLSSPSLHSSSSLPSSELESESEDTGHGVNVVGYGVEGTDPTDLKNKPYFIIRESLAPDAIHYKVAAQDFLNSILVIVKITGVSRQNLPMKTSSGAD